MYMHEQPKNAKTSDRSRRFLPYGKGMNRTDMREEKGEVKTRKRLRRNAATVFE